MNDLFKESLFRKNILVYEEGPENKNWFETLYSLAQLFGIHIVEGDRKKISADSIPFVAKQLGIAVPNAFYKGFPQSVRSLSKQELLFDQLLHYSRTYGAGDFSEAGASVFEEEMERAPFDEKTKKRKFRLLSESEGMQLILSDAEAMLKRTRPLSDSEFEILSTCISECGLYVYDIASQNTAIRLMVAFRSLAYADAVVLSDIPKVVDELLYVRYPLGYGRDAIKNLNLKNQDRKWLTALIDAMFESGKNKVNISDCFEKKAIWAGLLHHLHYKPKCEAAADFVAKMRGKKNDSVFSRFEWKLKNEGASEALDVLLDGKGSGAVLRNLNYLLSRCENEAEIDGILSRIEEATNEVVLLQLYYAYDRILRYGVAKPRCFRFTKHNLMYTHTEDENETQNRKSFLQKEVASRAHKMIQKRLKHLWKGRFGKVYIDPKMKQIAWPLSENTTEAGYGVLPKGSKIYLKNAKTVRAFTYWEKVDDIDLSCVGLTEDGRCVEFSWRTMHDLQSKAITFSGDQTSGYNGGSEYFDIQIKEFKKEWPEVRYVIFSDNVYSCVPFCAVTCRAGYMLRKHPDSGEVFEPKTVKSSFKINSATTFVHLFGLDMREESFVWLNISDGMKTPIAGEQYMWYLTDYFTQAEAFSVYDFFAWAAKTIVDRPEEADVVVSDDLSICEGKKCYHSYDFATLMALIA